MEDEWHSPAGSAHSRFFFPVLFSDRKFGLQDMEAIFDELKLVNPTTMSAAPRFYDKIYSQFQAAVAIAREQNPDFSTAELEVQIIPQFRFAEYTQLPSNIQLMLYFLDTY